jgi:putative chitinase
MSPINRNFFFTQVRRTLFANALQQAQVDGLNAILDGWEAKYAEKDKRWLAYALATAYHETARTMQPIEEFGKGRGRPYGKRYPQTGQVYYGRGLVQLTWYYNYDKMKELLGVDLVHHPELALDPKTATNIMFVGMLDGIFTGKTLANYFGEVTEDWIHARRIINGLDKAQAIAAYGRNFHSALSLTKSLPASVSMVSSSTTRLPDVPSIVSPGAASRALTAAPKLIDAKAVISSSIS